MAERWTSKVLLQPQAMAASIMTSFALGRDSVDNVGCCAAAADMCLTWLFLSACCDAVLSECECKLYVSLPLFSADAGNSGRSASSCNYIYPVAWADGTEIRSPTL